MSVDSGQISGLLQRWVKGDPEALDAVVPVIYQELRRLAHFVAIASRLMRQILVQYARRHQANKRDGGNRIALEEIVELPIAGDEELVALDDALETLTRIDDRQSKIVQMKFFGGLSAHEIAGVLEISVATVERDWATARIWLHREMTRAASP